jgi:hypothetical protein
VDEDVASAEEELDAGKKWPGHTPRNHAIETAIRKVTFNLLE